jgi:TetR/AcrR family transcriptional repressor of nem operon
MRTKDPAPATRCKLLDAAEALMLSKGFVATTVDEICSAARLTKGSFFHYFESKEELGKVLLERFSKNHEAAMMEACAEIEDPLERVYAMIDCAIEAARDPSTKGCLVGTFAQEISDTHPELRKVCECSFERVAEAVARDLVAAKERHAKKAPFDAESLGSYFLALGQGSLLLLKVTGDRKLMERNLLHFKRYLKSLYGR